MKKEPLIIENQGSFAIGGKTKSMKAFSAQTIFLRQKGRLPMATTRMYFIKFPYMPGPIPWYFSMVVPSASGRGNRHLMAVRDSKISFFARDTLRIS